MIEAVQITFAIAFFYNVIASDATSIMVQLAMWPVLVFWNLYYILHGLMYHTRIRQLQKFFFPKTSHRECFLTFLRYFMALSYNQ